MFDKQSTHIASEHFIRTIGREAQKNNIFAAKIVAEIVKTTLGPKGMDKMLVDRAGNITITNDGVTILEEMEFDHPVARLIVDVAKTQENEVGDGTTTVALLIGSLLENAEKLIDRKIHPTMIAKGYKIAADKSYEIIKEIAVPADDLKIFKKIVTTSMTGKGAEEYKEKFAELIVSAIEKIAEGRKFDKNNIKIVKIMGGRLDDSELIEGVIVEKEVSHADMPRFVKEVKIALLDTSLEIHEPETEARLTISSPEQLRAFMNLEEQEYLNMAKKIIDSGARVLFCQKGIDDVVQYHLAKAGIMSIRRVSRSDMEILSRATSAKIVSNINEISNKYLGFAESVEEIKIGENPMIYITGCKNPKAVTIAIYGGTSHLLDEIERVVKDCIGVVNSVVEDKYVVAGGGSLEIELSKRLKMYARTLPGKEQLAVNSFADSLEIIPEALAENAGLDSIEILTELKKRHEANDVFHGINLLNDSIENCFLAGLIEPARVKTQAISAATEVASMILRIDDVLISSAKDDSKNKSIVEND